MLKVQLIGDDALIAKFDAMPAKVRQALKAKVTALAIEMDSKVVDKLSGPVLNRKTGALARSINWLVEDQGQAVIGKVRSSGDVKYAAIHEFGGVIHHPGGTAYIIESGQAVWISNAKAATMENVRRTAPHDITMPERSYMRSTLADMKDEIEEGLREAVHQGVQIR
jgi:phage gpG-like protein